jgi:hypothetical protein
VEALRREAEEHARAMRAVEEAAEVQLRRQQEEHRTALLERQALLEADRAKLAAAVKQALGLQGELAVAKAGHADGATATHIAEVALLAEEHGSALAAAEACRGTLCGSTQTRNHIHSNLVLRTVPEATLQP